MISKTGFLKIMQSLMDYQGTFCFILFCILYFVFVLFIVFLSNWLGGTITIMGKAYKDTESLCDEFFSMIDNNSDGEITYLFKKICFCCFNSFL